MALSDKLIDAEAFARWGDMKGAPLAMCRGFARAIEAEVRKQDDERPTPPYTHPSPPGGMLGGRNGGSND